MRLGGFFSFLFCSHLLFDMRKTADNKRSPISISSSSPSTPPLSANRKRNIAQESFIWQRPLSSYVSSSFSFSFLFHSVFERSFSYKFIFGRARRDAVVPLAILVVVSLLYRHTSTHKPRINSRRMQLLRKEENNMFTTAIALDTRPYFYFNFVA